jgi:hypothetical protein
MSSSARNASSAGFTGTGCSREVEPAWSISACRSLRTVPNSVAPTFERLAGRLGAQVAARTIASTRSSTASSW